MEVFETWNAGSFLVRRKLSFGALLLIGRKVRLPPSSLLLALLEDSSQLVSQIMEEPQS